MPILIAALRAGLEGWIPANDAAPTVLRAHYSLDLSPSLVGMYTDATVWTDASTFFAGPWHLWWMSLPIRVLGTTWGPLLSMALLNSLWMLLAGWCVKRRLGYGSAMGALVLLATLNWSLGISALRSPVPMVMIVPAFAAFLFGAWALAAGDEGVLPVVALLANFLLLDHLVATLLVPVIVVGASICWTVHVVMCRRQRGGDWPAIRRRSLRAACGAAIVTAVMWIPTIIQETTSEPGNLTNLFRAAHDLPPSTSNWSWAFTSFISLFTQPPFWLRGSRSVTGSSLSILPSPTVKIAVAGVLCLVVLVLGWAAIRRRDWPASTALVMAVVAVGASLTNMARSSFDVLSKGSYFVSNWALAMFLTFALCFAFVRALPNRPRRFARAGTVGLAVLLAALNLPHSNFTGGTTQSTDAVVDLSRTLNAQVLQAVQGRGRVAISAPTLMTYPYVAALTVALDDADVPFCVNGIRQLLGSPIHDCDHRTSDVRITYTTDAGSTPYPGSRVIAQASSLTVSDRAELASLTDQLRHAESTLDAKGSPVALDPEFAEFMKERSPTPRGTRANPVASDFNLDQLGSSLGRYLLATRIQVAYRLTGERHILPISYPGVTAVELIRWTELELLDHTESVRVLMQRVG